MASSETSRLFKPITVGSHVLSHRMAMAPMTRYRATDEHNPTDDMVRYYKQRSSTPGTLIITEGTFISPEDGGFANVPGLYTDDQIAGWKKVINAIHANKSVVFCQLWSIGRAARTEVAELEGVTVSSASPLPLDDEHLCPKALTKDEINARVRNYAAAAKNAIAAGLDDVEIHAANGYLIDQFTQSNTNHRSDEYGGSVENRARFVLEVAIAVSEAIGGEKTGIRLSPWSHFQGMRMEDPVPQFSHIIRGLNRLDVAYLHLVESRISGSIDAEGNDSLNFAHELWKGPLIVAGGYTGDSAAKLSDEEHPQRQILVGFGRYWVSTPDLPFRIQQGLDLVKYDRSHFYTKQDPVGYIDYPYSEEFAAWKASMEHGLARERGKI